MNFFTNNPNLKYEKKKHFFFGGGGGWGDGFVGGGAVSGAGVSEFYLL